MGISTKPKILIQFANLEKALPSLQEQQSHLYKGPLQPSSCEITTLSKVTAQTLSDNLFKTRADLAVALLHHSVGSEVVREPRSPSPFEVHWLL